MLPSILLRQMEDGPLPIYGAAVGSQSSLPSLRRDHMLAELGSELNAALTELQFDSINRQLRFNYGCVPLPTYSERSIRDTLASISLHHISDRQRAVIKLFMLGDPISTEEFRSVFGERGEKMLSLGLDQGLFRIGDHGDIQTDRLILTSRRLLSGEVIFLFADHPSRSLKEGGQQVYLHTDSYYLSSKIDSLDPQSGVAVEYGSGSGIQLITLLKSHPQVEHGFGLEINARAREVSRLNFAINGVSERTTLVSSVADLSLSLGNRKVSLAFSNPPFLPIPEEVILDLPNSSSKARAILQIGSGGVDGLKHSRVFINEIKDHLADNGRIIIYSQFAADLSQPSPALAIGSQYGFNSHFEQFPSKSYLVSDSMQIEEWAHLVSCLLYQQGVIEKLTDSHSTLLKRTFLDAGIQRIISGFLEIRNQGPSMPSESETARLKEAEEKLGLHSRANSYGLTSAILHNMPAKIFAAKHTKNQARFSPLGYDPVKLISLKEAGASIYSLKLVGGYNLDVKECEGIFRYLVTDNSGDPVEEGNLYADLQQTDYQARFREVLESSLLQRSDEALLTLQTPENLVMTKEDAAEVGLTDLGPGRLILTRFPGLHSFVVENVDLELAKDIKTGADRYVLDLFDPRYPRVVSVLSRSGSGH